MKKLLKVVLVFFAVGAVAAVLSLGIGALLPESYSRTRTVEIKQSSEAIWEALTNYAKQTEFRPDLYTVTKLENNGQNEVWVETYKNGESMTFETTEFEFGKKLTRTLVDQVMNGSWTFALEPIEGGTRLALTETSTLQNPFFRFVSRVVIGSKYMDQFLRELSAKFGETAQIQ